MKLYSEPYILLKGLFGKELKQVDEERVKIYVLYDGMEHLSKNLTEGIQNRYPVLTRDA